MASPSSPSPTTQFTAPSSILILGSGVFGLSTALTLSTRPSFTHSTITLIDPSPFPNPSASSIDTSRIIRADYSQPAYAHLASAAQSAWRRHGPNELGGSGRYTESGLVLVCDQGTPGEQYVRASFENVKRLARESGDEDAVQELPSREAIQQYMKSRGGDDLGATGDWGYINHRSGWADAEAAMVWLRRKVEATGRVKFIQDDVISLIKTKLSSSTLDANKTESITGVTLASGVTVSADLAILATGAWTGKLIDLRGRATATGQVLAYLDLERAEQERLAKMPVLLNMSSGMFVIPPGAPPPSPSSLSSTEPERSQSARSASGGKESDNNEDGRTAVLKIARHAYGYLNPTRIVCPNGTDKGKPISVSLPAVFPASLYTHQIPPSALPNFTSFLDSVFPCLSHSHSPSLPTANLIPNPNPPPLCNPSPSPAAISLSLSNPFSSSRICYYTDTPHGDFLISYHPAIRNLFLATGGSGHAFKFLPVLGDRIVDVIEGKKEASEGEREEGLFERWSWKRAEDVEITNEEVMTQDGSRSGKKGALLSEEFEWLRDADG